MIINKQKLNIMKKKVIKRIVYEKVDEFAKSVGRSRRTIFRFYAKNANLQEETKIKNGCKMIPITHKKYWNIEALYADNIFLGYENRTMTNTLDALQNSNVLSRKLWFLPWTHVITISPRKERGLDYCTSKMRQFYYLTDNKYGKKTNLRIFFNCEKHKERNGYHMHIVLNVENKKFHQLVLDLLKQDFILDRTDISEYDYRKGFLFYAIKNEDDLKTDSWGIDGNNLAKENINYAV